MDKTNDYKNESDLVKLSNQYLESTNKNPDICSILELMYIDISQQYNHTENLILANILTAVDYFCHSKFNKQQITPDQFRQLDKTISSKIGSLFLPEVGAELFNMLYETIKISQSTTFECNVIIYNNIIDDKWMLQSCLNNLGFSTFSVSTIDELRESLNKNKAYILVIESIGTVLQVSDLVNQIEDADMDFENVTTYLLTNREIVYELSGLYQKGIEDIFSIENDIDPFLVKIIRHKKRLKELAQKQLAIFENMGTFGSLADMNLIDLLQIMNGSGKTCIINVTAHHNQLTIHIDNGNIISAEIDDLKGERALFEAMSWKKGVWSVDPLDTNKIPIPNINKSINSILLEGCQYMDESQKIVTNLDKELDNTFDFL